jgi:hypothetical protein
MGASPTCGPPSKRKDWLWALAQDLIVRWTSALQRLRLAMRFLAMIVPGIVPAVLLSCGASS